MRFFHFASLLALYDIVSGDTLRPRAYDTHDYYAVHLQPQTSPSDFAAHLGLELEGSLGHLQDHYLLRHPRHGLDIVREAVQTHKRRKRKRGTGYENSILDGVLFHQKQHLKPPKVKRTPLPPPPIGLRQHSGVDYGTGQEANETAVKQADELATTLDISDPIFHEQWHLFNTVQVGHDLNVTGVWLNGTTGKNATVCIVDDGLDMDSNDLKDNYFAEGSHDFNDESEIPRPRLSDDRHGTRCAGEVAAVKNDVCGVGVAWDAKVAGIRILSKAITDADEATAMTYGFQQNDIYSCSWGPPDDGKEMGEPGILIKRAMVTAVQQGRGGRGTIYVFAAGNGASADDNCNFDGYTNSIYSITVGAIDRMGKHPYYSEKCSAQLAVTYSSGSNDAIHTTDVGANQCYTRHGGTSAAGPLAAGIYALVLEARPDLTWRDMQWLTVLTAVTLENDDDEWQNTSIGKPYNHQYGFGKLDAWALVSAAQTFQPVKPQAWYFSPWQHVRAAIPQGDVGLSSHYSVTASMLADANLERLEHLTVTMNVEHTRRGDLSVELRSPHGIASHLSTARRSDDYRGGYEDWTFMSVAHWGEDPAGDWTIVVKDTRVDDNNGTFVDWKLNLFGECTDASRQDLLPLPAEHDDDAHDEDHEDAPVSTAPVDNPSPTGAPPGNPSDHIDRPVNVKPTDAATTTTAAFEPPSATLTPGEEEGLADGVDEEQPDTTSSPTATATPAPPDNFLPSPFPTFGVSKRTQVWIYGALTLILVFIGSLSVYYCVFVRRRRTRQRASRDGYEFDFLKDEDDDDDSEDDHGRKIAGGGRGGRFGDGRNGGAGGGLGNKKRKPRAGELYDAFAGEGESDEDLFSDGEKGGYKDDDDDDDDDGHGARRGRRGLLGKAGSSDEGSSGSGSGSGGGVVRAPPR